MAWLGKRPKTLGSAREGDLCEACEQANLREKFCRDARGRLMTGDESLRQTGWIVVAGGVLLSLLVIGLLLIPVGLVLLHEARKIRKERERGILTIGCEACLTTHLVQNVPVRVVNEPLLS